MRGLIVLRRHLTALPGYLLTLPPVIRLSIAIVCTAFTLILYMMLSNPAKNPSILVVPMVVVAWMYRRPGVFICLGVTFVIMWVYYCFTTRNVHYFLLPAGSVITFIAGTLALVIVGLLISFLRDSLDLAEKARQGIAKSYEQEQQLSQIKDHFIQNVNHELRTPLTALSGYIELLLEHDEQLDAQTRRSFLKNAMYSCDELQLMVSNVLDSIHIENEKEFLKLEAIPLAALVQEVLDHTDPRSLQKFTIEQHIPVHLTILAHSQYLRQILRNLLSNAFKYAPADTAVIISATYHGSGGQPYGASSEVCISIRDFGAGIPTEDIPQVFGQFVRLQRDISGRVRGTGLGLYISKQLVEAMGGRIWVESTGIAGQGSCFNFTLPCADSSSIGAKPQNMQASEA